MSESNNTASLDDVLDKEWDTISKRELGLEGKAKKRGGGLVDLSSIADESHYSDRFMDVWRSLKTPDQEARWAEFAKGRGHAGLVGLAFSGGGIRSATFGLGVLLVLMRLRLFNCVDYLSTVSGGGYLGSWWSSLCAKKDFSPVDASVAGAEDARVRYLRNNAKYIAPNGIIDMLRIPAVLLRGAMVNLIAITPYLLLAVLITYFMDVKNNESDCHGLTEKIYSGSVEYLSLGKGFVDAFSGNCEAQFSAVSLPGFMLLGDNLAFINTPFFYSLIAVSLFVVFIILFPIANMFIERTTVFKHNAWEFRKIFDRFAVWLIVIIGVAIFMEIQPIAIAFLDENNWRLQLSEIGGYTGLYTLLSAGFVSKIRDKLSNLSSQIALLLLGGVTFLVIWFVYLALSLWVIDGYAVGVLNDRLVILAVVIGATVLYSLMFININITSLHNFYRDVLSKAYLIQGGSEGITHNDGQKLSTLDTDKGPYHLINTVLNVSDNTSVYNGERKADFFLFSKHFIGSVPTGYARTTDIENVSDHVNLGTAMAISGAAASPSMGRFTKQSIAFLLALFNIRLNYWFPNPSRVSPGEKVGLWSSFKYRATSWYLIPELIGKLTSRSKLINLSDGGHLENLGVYELLRRQCRLIIVSDGECDPNLRYQGLLELIRMARVDLSISIDMQGLDGIREGEQQFAVGTIDYGDGRLGKLIYLKLALCKEPAAEELEGSLSFDDNSYMAYYQSQHPDFPHETTADQFFDEAQFECYRALGCQVAESFFAKEPCE